MPDADQKPFTAADVPDEQKAAFQELLITAEALLGTPLGHADRVALAVAFLGGRRR